jgi:hypothetical protein
MVKKVGSQRLLGPVHVLQRNLLGQRREEAGVGESGGPSRAPSAALPPGEGHDVYPELVGQALPADPGRAAYFSCKRCSRECSERSHVRKKIAHAGASPSSVGGYVYRL